MICSLSPTATNIIAWRESPGTKQTFQPLAEGEQQIDTNLFDTFSVGAFVFIVTYGFTIGYIVCRLWRLETHLSERFFH